MKTLIIHPIDPTTDFLCRIYEDLSDKEVFRTPDEFEKNNLLKGIKNVERTIILGHGMPFGLLGFGKLVLDNYYAKYLIQQENNIYIWCHANVFVRNNLLKGFCSGMFISEIQEAKIYNISVGEEEIRKSNDFFAELMNYALKKTHHKEKIHEILKKNYIIKDNPVCEFNNQRLYFF